MLANYFGISIDELFGMSEIEKKNQYCEINRIWDENNKTGLHQENVALMRQSLKIFPNNSLLLVQLSTSLEKLEGTNEEKLQYLRESIAVQEQILRYGEDSEIRGVTLYNICFTYWKVGEYDKALQQAKKLPNLYKAQENALVYFLQGEEKHKVAREALIPIAWIIAHHMTALYETENDPTYLTKAEKILDILFEAETENNFIRSIRGQIHERVSQ